LARSTRFSRLRDTIVMRCGVWSITKPLPCVTDANAVVDIRQRCLEILIYVYGGGIRKAEQRMVGEARLQSIAGSVIKRPG
jgi:hypothetical protein